MGMIFFHAGREYAGGTAAEIVRAMVRDSDASPSRAGEIRAFVLGALEGLADRIHRRELEVGRHLSDEALAFNYLCLLDEYGIGQLQVSAPATRAPDEAEG